MSRFGSFRISKTTRRSVGGFVTTALLLLLLLQGAGLRPFLALQSGMVRFGSALGRGVGYIRGYSSYQAELAKLKQEVEAFAFDQNEQVRLQEENRELRALLGFTETSEHALNTIPANVLMRAFDEHRALFVLNKGSANGVVEGAAVIADQGVLIGTVLSVREHVSTVRLLTDQRSRVAAKFQFTDTTGIVEGAKGSILRFGFIPQRIPVTENDLVFTSGLEAYLPPGLLIGRVLHVTDDDTEPFKSATIEPLIDVRFATVVGIVLPPLVL